MPQARQRLTQTLAEVLPILIRTTNPAPSNTFEHSHAHKQVAQKEIQSN